MNSWHGSFLEVLRQIKCSSWFLNVIIQHFVHWFQNCAQLNQSIRSNIPGFSLADCQLLESYQPMRNQDALDVMLWFNQAQFWNQWTKCRMMALRNQLEHFFCLNTSRKDPCKVKNGHFGKYFLKSKKGHFRKYFPKSKRLF